MPVRHDPRSGMIYRGIGLRWRPGVRNETARLVSSATWTSGRTRRGGFRPLRDVARILDRFDRRYVINSSRAARGARAAAPARPQIPAAAVTARPHTWPGSAVPWPSAPPRGFRYTRLTFRSAASRRASSKNYLSTSSCIQHADARSAIRGYRPLRALAGTRAVCRLTVLTRRRRARARSGIRLVFVRLLSLFSLTSTHLCAC